MSYQIKHRITGAVLFAGDYASLRECVVAAVKAYADLAYADLAYADLAYADLAYADLTRANLTDADLAYANLTDANLTRADLTRANLAGANLTDADLTYADLAYADLAYADLAYADLTRANLTDADLVGADLAYADLTRANLTDADLGGAYLAYANLAGANLSGANLTDANLTGADLTDANLTGADLTDADLAGAGNVPTGISADPATPYDPKPLAERRAERMARYRETHPEVPVIEAPDAKILQVLETGAGKLKMDQWHTCKTTHCRAGWAITLAGEAGARLESEHGAHRAGVMIYRASTGRVPYFFATDEQALEDIREQATLNEGRT